MLMHVFRKDFLAMLEHKNDKTKQKHKNHDTIK